VRICFAATLGGTSHFFLLDIHNPQAVDVMKEQTSAQKPKNASRSFTLQDALDLESKLSALDVAGLPRDIDSDEENADAETLRDRLRSVDFDVLYNVLHEL